MKPILIVFLSSLLIQNILFAFTLIIDPGHGGDDKGATQGKIKESDIALNVALKLITHFENDPSVKVVLTRSDDTSLTLKKRVETNSINNGDLFISLHVNSSTDKRAKGADFYIGNPEPTAATLKTESATVDSIVQNVNQTIKLYQSQFLALDTYQSWQTSSVTLPRSIKQGPFYVINKNKVPSILVEFGFITNSKEATELVKAENQTAIAKSLYHAVKNFQARVRK